MHIYAHSLILAVILTLTLTQALVLTVRHTKCTSGYVASSRSLPNKGEAHVRTRNRARSSTLRTYWNRGREERAPLLPVEMKEGGWEERALLLPVGMKEGGWEERALFL